MSYLYLKAIHVVFIVAWFAGLFYNIRLFIYQTEANEREEPARSILGEQLQLMSGRLWHIITWPASLISLAFGVWLIFPLYSRQMPGWLWLKLGLVALLYIYQLYSYRLYREMKKGVFRHSSQWLRMYNEGATMLLVAIVFLVIVRSSLSVFWGVAGLILLGIVLMIAVKLYKRSREKKI